MNLVRFTEWRRPIRRGLAWANLGFAVVGVVRVGLFLVFERPHDAGDAFTLAIANWLSAAVLFDEPCQCNGGARG